MKHDFLLSAERLDEGLACVVRLLVQVTEDAAVIDFGVKDAADAFKVRQDALLRAVSCLSSAAYRITD